MKRTVFWTCNFGLCQSHHKTKQNKKRLSVRIEEDSLKFVLFQLLFLFFCCCISGRGESRRVLFCLFLCCCGGGGGLLFVVASGFQFGVYTIVNSRLYVLMH